MKKFWNLMLAALVIFGAVACTEKEVAPEQNAGMSFTATIDLDETRTDVVFNETEKVWKTVWTGNETLMVLPKTGLPIPCTFTNTPSNPNKFTCADASSVVGKNVKIQLVQAHESNMDSKAGKAGGSLYAEVDNFTADSNVTLSVGTAFLRYSSASEVTLSTAGSYIFDYSGNKHDSITLPAGEDVWVAVKPGTVNLSYSIDGDVVKTKEDLTIEAKKIYNLGTLAKAEPVKSEYGVVGSFQGWDVAVGKPVVMYTEGDWAVARGIELFKDYEFKIVKGNSWDESYGLSALGVVELDKEVSVIKSGQNMKVAKNGKFDISFNATTKKIMVVCVEEYADLMVNITINNKANWSPLTITLKDGDSVIANKATVTGNKFPVSGEYIGKTLSCQFFSGSKESEVMNVSITKTGATVTLEETIIKLKVQLTTDNAKKWWGDTMKIHVWNTGTSFDTSWPGHAMTSEDNYTWSIIVPSELVGKTIEYVINNGGSWKSNDSKVTIKAEGNTINAKEIGIV